MAKKEEVKIDKCHGDDCKKSEWKFTFCEEHYEQFKFGLIKKDGTNVPDYDKKLGHYLQFKKAARKVA